MDGRTTHTRNLESTELAGVTRLMPSSPSARATRCLPQLGVSFSVYFNQASQKWKEVHTGRTITQFQISELVGEA
jgi:hypothetical protein